jgi:hypothetical protein
MFEAEIPPDLWWAQEEVWEDEVFTLFDLPNSNDSYIIIDKPSKGCSAVRDAQLYKTAEVGNYPIHIEASRVEGGYQIIKYVCGERVAIAGVWYPTPMNVFEINELLHAINSIITDIKVSTSADSPDVRVKYWGNMHYIQADGRIINLNKPLSDRVYLRKLCLALNSILNDLKGDMERERKTA